MKNIIAKRILGVLVIVALFLGGCADNDDYANALPNDAAAVVVLDLNSLAEKSGLSGEENPAMKNRIVNLLKSGLSGADDLINRIYDDPSESGIGLNKGVFLFAGREWSTTGVVAKVEDEGKLENLLDVISKQNLCAPVMETDGGHWTYMGKWIIAYSSKSLVLMSDTKSYDASKLERRASMMLRQQDGEGFAGKKDFSELMAKKSDVGIWMSLDIMPREKLFMMTAGISGGLSLSEVRGLMHLNLEKGKTVVEWKSLMEDDIMNNFTANIQTSMGTIEGKHLSAFPANTPVWMAANVKGKQMYEFINGIPLVKNAFVKTLIPLDFESIFSALNGDMSFAITDVMNGKFILMGDVDNENFMSTFEDLKPLLRLTNGQMVLNTVGNHEYEFYASDASALGLGSGRIMLWFGVRDGRLYLTNDKNLVDRKVLGLSLEDNSWSGIVKGQRVFMAVNMKSLQYGVMNKKALEAFERYTSIPVSGIDCLVLSSREPNSGSIEIGHTEKNKTFLEVLLSAIL